MSGASYTVISVELSVPDYPKMAWVFGKAIAFDKSALVDQRPCTPPVMLPALVPANDAGIFPISDSWRYCAPKMESLVRVLRQSS